MNNTHQPCPCGKSSDAYAYYPDGGEYCFSCGKGGGKMKQPEDFNLIKGSDYRGIKQWVLDLYGAETYGTADDDVLYRVYRDPTNGASKVRRCRDKEFIQRNGRVSPLYGAWAFNEGCAHYITVVEGEEDAMAAFQMLNSKADGKQTAALNPVVAIPGGTISKRDREVLYKYLSSFTTVKLCIEDDDTGKKAKDTLATMLPNKVREVRMTKHKDANEYLTNGDTREFKGAWERAGLYTPDNIYHTHDDIVELLADEQQESYVPTGISALDEKIKGLAMNHITLITAMEGMGKTELLRKFEYEVIKSGVPIGVLHFEETKAKNIRALACYEAGDNMRKEEDKQRVAEYFARLSNDYENFYLFEFHNDPTIEEVEAQVNYLVHVCGVQYVFIDPINQFDPPEEMSRVDFLDGLSKRMEKYVVNNPCGLVWTAHVDDEGRTRNSRMIAKACSTRIDLKRDHLCEDVDERNTLELTVTKNRQWGETGPAGTAFFDPHSFTVKDEVVFEPNQLKQGVPF